MEGVAPLDELAIQQELHRRLQDRGACPQCESDRVRYKEAVGEYPQVPA